VNNIPSKLQVYLSHFANLFVPFCNMQFMVDGRGGQTGEAAV